MAPWVRARLDPRQRASWVEAEPQTSNTNPYLFGLLVGVRQRVEEEHGPQLAQRVTLGLQSALGALGDALMWSAWRPACALAAALAGHFGGSAGVLVLWLGFAVAQARLRQWGLQWGLREGMAAIESLTSLDIGAWTRRGRAVGAVLAGVLFVIVLHSATPVLGTDPGPAAALLAGAAGLVAALRRLRGETAILAAAGALWLLARVGGFAG